MKRNQAMLHTNSSLLSGDIGGGSNQAFWKDMRGLGKANSLNEERKKRLSNLGKSDK